MKSGTGWILSLDLLDLALDLRRGQVPAIHLDAADDGEFERLMEPDRAIVGQAWGAFLSGGNGAPGSRARAGPGRCRHSPTGSRAANGSSGHCAGRAARRPPAPARRPPANLSCLRRSTSSSPLRLDHRFAPLGALRTEQLRAEQRVGLDLEAGPHLALWPVTRPIRAAADGAARLDDVDSDHFGQHQPSAPGSRLTPPAAALAASFSFSTGPLAGAAALPDSATAATAGNSLSIDVRPSWMAVASPTSFSIWASVIASSPRICSLAKICSAVIPRFAYFSRTVRRRVAKVA